MTLCGVGVSGVAAGEVMTATSGTALFSYGVGDAG